MSKCCVFVWFLGEDERRSQLHGVMRGRAHQERDQDFGCEDQRRLQCPLVSTSTLRDSRPLARGMSGCLLVTPLLILDTLISTWSIFKWRHAVLQHGRFYGNDNQFSNASIFLHDCAFLHELLHSWFKRMMIA